MKIKIITMLTCLLSLSFISSLGHAALNAVNVGSAGVTFPDNSVQQKAVVLPTCLSGEVYVNNSGTLYCGKIKLVPNGIATCVGSACSVSTCMDGFGDCNSDANNGCETNLLVDSQHCGACGTACNVNGVCSSGGCTYPPQLISLAPNPSYVVVGQSIYMNAVLSAPALGDTIVSLTADIPSMATVDSQVTIPMGQTQGQFLVTAYSSGSVTITGFLNGINISGSVIVLDNPCISNPCTSPPPNFCSGPNLLTTYSIPGNCSPQQGAPFYSCSYPSFPSGCPLGCSGSACQH